MNEQIFCAAHVELHFDLSDREPFAVPGGGERQTEDEATFAACHSAALELSGLLRLDSLTHIELKECNAWDGVIGGSGTVRRTVASYEMCDGAVIPCRRLTKVEKISAEVITSVCKRTFEDARQERLNQLNQDQ